MAVKVPKSVNWSATTCLAQVGNVATTAQACADANAKGQGVGPLRRTSTAATITASKRMSNKGLNIPHLLSQHRGIQKQQQAVFLIMCTENADANP